MKPSIPRDGSQSKGAPCASSGFFLPQLLLERYPSAPVDPTRPVRCRSFFLLIWTLASERAAKRAAACFSLTGLTCGTAIQSRRSGPPEDRFHFVGSKTLASPSLALDLDQGLNCLRKLKSKTEEVTLKKTPFLQPAWAARAPAAHAPGPCDLLVHEASVAFPHPASSAPSGKKSHSLSPSLSPQPSGPP